MLTDPSLAAPCPLSWCLALPGEECISRTHPGRTVPPHQHRPVAAGETAPPTRNDLEQESA